MRVFWRLIVSQPPDVHSSPCGLKAAVSRIAAIQPSDLELTNKNGPFPTFCQDSAMLTSFPKTDLRAEAKRSRKSAHTFSFQLCFSGDNVWPD